MTEEYSAWASRSGGLLVFLGVIACLSPLFGDLGSGGGRMRVFLKMFQMLGSFAPLVGLALGAGGAALLGSGLKKSSSGPITALTFLLMIACTGIGTVPMFQKMAANLESSNPTSNSSKITRSPKRPSKNSGSGWGSFFGSSNRVAIEKVMSRHNEIINPTGYSSAGRMHRHMSNVSPVAALRMQVSSIEGISTSACPDDFKNAYGKHVAAYRSLVDYATSNDKLIYNSQEELGQFNRRIEQLAKSVDSTATEANRIAEKHGVKIVE